MWTIRLMAVEKPQVLLWSGKSYRMVNFMQSKSVTVYQPNEFSCQLTGSCKSLQSVSETVYISNTMHNCVLHYLELVSFSAVCVYSAILLAGFKVLGVCSYILFLLFCPYHNIRRFCVIICWRTARFVAFSDSMHGWWMSAQYALRSCRIHGALVSWLSVVRGDRFVDLCSTELHIFHMLFFLCPLTLSGIIVIPKAYFWTVSLISTF